MDRRKCCVNACVNLGKPPRNDFHLYGLPKNLDIRCKWLTWIGQVNRVDPNSIVVKNLFVCSDHFPKEVKGLKKLKSGAVPCLLVSTPLLPSPSDIPSVCANTEAENDVSSNNNWSVPCLSNQRPSSSASSTLSGISLESANIETGTHDSSNSNFSVPCFSNISISSNALDNEAGRLFPQPVIPIRNSRIRYDEQQPSCSNEILSAPSSTRLSVNENSDKSTVPCLSNQRPSSSASSTLSGVSSESANIETGTHDSSNSNFSVPCFSNISISSNALDNEAGRLFPQPVIPIRNSRIRYDEQQPLCSNEILSAPSSTRLSVNENSDKSNQLNRCFVTACSGDVAVQKIRHFHKLPKHEETRIKWCKWIAEVNGMQWEDLLNSNITICSNHFKENDLGFKKVKKFAVPSILSCDLYDSYSAVIEVDLTCVQASNTPLTANDEQTQNSLPLCVDTLAIENNALEFDFNLPDLFRVIEDEHTINNLQCIMDEDEQITDARASQHVDIVNSPTGLKNEPSIVKTKKPPGTRKSCAATGCNNVQPRKFFTFPAIVLDNIVNDINLERCRKWIQGCGNEKLLHIPSSRLHNRYYVCSDHFEISQFYSINSGTLLPSAVPRKFSCAPLEDTVMLQYPVWGTENLVTDVPDSIFDNLQINFENVMHSVKWRTCLNCKEKFFIQGKSDRKCLHSQNICRHYCQPNDMDPGIVPPELQGLSYVEEQLIAKVHPLISVFKLRGHHQYGYRGNIINFPQNVSSFAKKLPHSLDNLKSIITVRTSDDVNPVDFHVRAGVIRKALLWLKQHNMYYHDIEISEDNLNSLPEDGNIYNSIQLSFNAETVEQEEADEDEEVEERNYSQIQETCVPMIGRPTAKAQAEVILGWPEISSDCINEFKTAGYVAMAFPTLFPNGQADLRNPREFNISPKKYFQHLLRYHDDRFAKHPRFRYFALNSIMRWTALSNGGIFVRKNSNFKSMNAEQLKEELENDPSLIRKLMFYNSNLQGTRSFWYTKGQELLSMVEQLGLPTLFFTLSAADLHWPDLFKFLSPDEDLQSMSDARRRKLVEEHPAKVDAFFALRGKTFITEVLRKKFQIDDLWYRIEYQHRGSPHIHGVMWLKDAPKFNDLSKSTEDELLQIANYFEQYICTTHPDINCPPAPIHPSKLRLAEIVDVKKDLAELLNRVQRHTKCSEAYCLRKNKSKGGKLECRFKFPVELRDHCQIIISEDRDVEFITARNDSYLNKYNPYIIQTWRANIDISPVISKRALVNYLAKYISKSETQSKDMMNIMKELLKNTDSEKTAKSVIQRLYIQSCCERDYSAQETCHLIMGLPLLSAGGRVFVNLNFKVLDPNSWVEVTDDEQSPSKSYIEKYMERPCEFEQETLWHMAKKYKLPKVQRHANGLDAIVRVFPKISERTKNDSDDYYKQQVLLHLPWRFEEEFLDKYNTWEEAYLLNEQRIRSSDVQCTLEDTNPDEEEYEQQNTDEHHITEQFMTSTILGPNQKTKDIDLGLREIDLSFNWHASASKYDQYGGIPVIKSFIQDKRKETHTDNTIPLMPSVTFTSEQQSVLNLLKLQIQSIKGEHSTVSTFSLPQSTIVQGKAGTGKSLLIHAMKSLIYEAFGENSFALIGPTGVSALNINGSTIHSKLYIHPKTRELLPLKSGALHDFQQKFEKTLFVLIDEYSMIGCGMLTKIEKRLREALDQEELPYGGLFVYFFGDVQQLAPVGDLAVYSEVQKYIDQINGKLLYNNINASIVLSQVQRQNNVDFQNLLNNISTGNVQEENFNLLKTRFKTSVSSTERDSFNDAIHLYPTRDEVYTHNVKKLRMLKDPMTASPVPVARVPALHNCPAAALASDNAAEGLESILYLAVGAKIMLRSNLWTEKGLVNGAIGHIVDILYDKDASPGENPPSALVCHFPSYKGPYLNEDKTVVIQPMTKTWRDNKGNDLTRIQFPVALSYACTIHKSQGLTLEKAFINIGVLKEMAPGLTYTALSRVKSIDGMLLEPFSFHRISSLNNKDYIKSRREWIEFLARREIDSLHI